MILFYAEKREGCSPNPCLNDGRCIETSSGSFDCICKPGFSGAICSGNIFNTNDWCCPYMSPLKFVSACKSMYYKGKKRVSFTALPFGQAVASMYKPNSHLN